MNIQELQSVMEIVHTVLGPEVDDVAWMNDETWEQFKQLFVPVRPEANLDFSLIEFAGMQCVVDETVPDDCIDTGTYAVKDGMVSKELRNRYSLIKHRFIEW